MRMLRPFQIAIDRRAQFDGMNARLSVIVFRPVDAAELCVNFNLSGISCAHRDIACIGGDIEFERS
jgi:hypothetical protein